MRTIPKLLGIVWLSLTLGLLSLLGCASKGEGTRTSGQYKQDQRLAQEVHDSLHHAPTYKYPDVTVNAYQGKVQLSGFVATEEQKQEAARIASQVQGVTGVVNSLLLVGAAESAPTGR